MTDPERRSGKSAARAGGALTGLGSAGGGLTIGPETLLGKLLILASPFTTVLVDYAVIQGQAALERWENDRPIRRARRTLKRAIKDQHMPEQRRALYREQLADLQDAEVAQQLAGVAIGKLTVLDKATDPDSHIDGGAP